MLSDCPGGKTDWKNDEPTSKLGMIGHVSVFEEEIKFLNTKI